ncbi:hypothetical protein BC832DRAFT_381770 [Gaertneriomyces semiglobifer]|nr:hypothetical protein BC832DRAFT_381770 [Gaertneriomyces semiglobifer]
MEGSGFRGDDGGGSSGSWGGGHDDFPSHNHHHHHNSNPAGSFAPGFLLGAIGGALGGYWWNRDGSSRFSTPYPNLRQPNYPYYSAVPPPSQPQPYAPWQQQFPAAPTYHPHPHLSESVPFLPTVRIPPPPTRTRKRACTASCCCLWLLVIGLILAIILVPKPGESAVKLVVGDRKLVPLNTQWMKEVEVSGGASEIDVYLFENAVPPLTDRLTLPQKMLDMKLEQGSFHYLRYDVHKGSSATVNWNFFKYDWSPSLIILKTEAAFQAWKSNSYVSSKFILHEQNTPKGEYKFVAPSYGEYYFIFYTKSRRMHAAGTATFDVTSVTYSLDKPDGYCPATDGDCSFTLRPGRPANLILVAPMHGDSYTVTYHTRARGEAYAALFVALSSAVAVCGGVILVAWCGLRCCNKCCTMICGGSSRDGYTRLETGEEAIPGVNGHTAGDAAASAPPPSSQPPPIPPYNPSYPTHGPSAPNQPPPYSVMDPIAV